MGALFVLPMADKPWEALPRDRRRGARREVTKPQGAFC